jgi:hypothetical protein
MMKQGDRRGPYLALLLAQYVAALHVSRWFYLLRTAPSKYCHHLIERETSRGTVPVDFAASE